MQQIDLPENRGFLCHCIQRSSRSCQRTHPCRSPAHDVGCSHGLHSLELSGRQAHFCSHPPQSLAQLSAPSSWALNFLNESMNYFKGPRNPQGPAENRKVLFLFKCPTSKFSSWRYTISPSGRQGRRRMSRGHSVKTSFGQRAFLNLCSAVTVDAGF